VRDTLNCRCYLVHGLGYDMVVSNYCTWLSKLPLFNTVLIFEVPITLRFLSSPNGSMNFFESACHCFHQEVGAMAVLRIQIRIIFQDSDPFLGDLG
jgi:hypothetical protein